MWVFTTSGFLSVVAYDDRRDGLASHLPDGARPEDMLVVRARVHEDLAAVLDALELPGSRAVSTPAADYPYRALLSRDQWARYLSAETQRIDYTNFKSKVQEVQGQRRHDLYLRVWSVLRGLASGPSKEDPHSALW